MALCADGLGQVTRVCGASSLGLDQAAAFAQGIQEHLRQHTRLGIPAIIHEEICSGLMAREATVFPQAIGVASTWMPALAHDLADAIRSVMVRTGARQGLSPVLDVCRDPRWGRAEETFGEDPYLVARMGVAFVRGLQGTDLRAGVVATAKHFVGYAMSEGGMNWAPAHIGARELRDVYLHPFEAAVREANLRSVMNGYHELDGVPCGANAELLTRVLRGEWGFDGIVVSDYFSVRQLETYHRLVADGSAAAVTALSAGMDVELPGTDCYGQPLAAAVADGSVDQSIVDEAVRRVLRVKFELGLFERPYEPADEASRAGDVIRVAAERELARRIAQRSLVLLHNDGVLPLPHEDSGTVAVIGPNADNVRHLYGDYTYPAHVESLLEMTQRGRNVFAMPLSDGVLVEEEELTGVTVFSALRERLGSRVAYERGCDVNTDDRSGFDAAVALAASSSVAVMVMGDRSGLTDDSTTGEGRDRASLDLPGLQEELVRAVVATGTPVVLVLVAGRPVGSQWLHEHCSAVLMAWLPGEEGGAAIADALLGRVNPGGKLPISFPRTAGQIPIFYGHKVSGGRSHWKGDYVDSPATPLYPFGYGLSYTTFALSGAVVEDAAVLPTESVTVTVSVTNTGPVAGDEVVQLYSRAPRASVTQPVLALRAFLRVPLAAGQTQTVRFTVPAAQLGFHGLDLAYVVEPGTVEFLVGTSADSLTLAGAVELLPGAPVSKAFTGTADLI
jgi:beta-glucosidase